jgi:hypothetical protein
MDQVDAQAKSEPMGDALCYFGVNVGEVGYWPRYLLW